MVVVTGSTGEVDAWGWGGPARMSAWEALMWRAEGDLRTRSSGLLVEVLDSVRRDADGRVEYHYVIIDYLCRVRGGAAVSGSDAADVRWVSVSELEGYRVSTTAAAVIRKAMTLVYAIYNKGFENRNSDLGTASAYAIVLLFIVLVLTAIQFGVLERKVFYR